MTWTPIICHDLGAYLDHLEDLTVEQAVAVCVAHQGRIDFGVDPGTDKRAVFVSDVKPDGTERCIGGGYTLPEAVAHALHFWEPERTPHHPKCATVEALAQRILATIQVADSYRGNGGHVPEFYLDGIRRDCLEHLPNEPIQEGYHHD